MKRIYVNTNTLNEAVAYLNNEITFFGFLSHTKAFLKNLLITPLSADIDDYLKDNGLDREAFINVLLSRNIIEKDTKIEDNNGNDKFVISFKIPKRNFERKMRRLYSLLFEQHEIAESRIINETDCAGAMQSGGMNPDSGQYTTPLGKIQRRRIYVTNEQIEIIKETTTNNTGDYQYDVPLNFNNGKDPAYNHKNMIAKGIPNKKIGIRQKK
jgi:hypothetical protein